MALDTENKRRALLADGDWNAMFPVPDGTLDTQDRLQMLALWRTESAGAAVGPPYNVQAGDFYVPGVFADDVFHPGTEVSDLFNPGTQAGEVST